MSRHLKTMPVLNTLPSAYWVADTTGVAPSGLKQSTEVDWRNVVLTAEELAVLVPIPDAVLADAQSDIWAEIRPLVEEAFGKAIDEAVLFGINKPASWPNDVKAGAIAAANVVAYPTGTDIAVDLNNLYAAVEADGYGVTGNAMHMALKAVFRGLRASTGEFIFKPGHPGAENTTFGNSAEAETGDLLGVRTMIGRNGAFEAELALATSVRMIAGDWSQMVLAVREDFNVQFSKHAVIQDAAGAIQYNAWQQDLTIGRFVGRFAYAIPNPVNRQQPTTASRFPFAILQDAA
jgi:HK97 family phage major capsid protein